MLASNQTLFYVSNKYYETIFVFDENWEYIFNRSSFFGIAHVFSITNYLYLTGDSNIWKTDEQLNILIQYNAIGTHGYRGLYHNSTNDLVYLAPYLLKNIHIFNLNLTFNDTIDTVSLYPRSIKYLLGHLVEQ
jgi:hypothetical protein